MKTNPMTMNVLSIGVVLFASSLTVQASPIVSDANLLSGQASTPANVLYTTGINTTANSGGSELTDGSINYNGVTGDGGFVFAQDQNSVPANAFEQEIAIALPSSSSLSSIVIWTANDIPPSEVTIYGSTSSTPSISTVGDTLLATDTNLGVSNLNLVSNGYGYFGYYDIPITSATAFKSLLFDFGTQNATDANGNLYDFTRVTELQAFAAVPEPSTYVLTGIGLAGVAVMLRRRSLS
jgi:hypothetical protein